MLNNRREEGWEKRGNRVGKREWEKGEGVKQQERRRVREERVLKQVLPLDQ